jgi:hypothetical protein
MPLSCFISEVEAPVKFLYPAPLSDTPRAYPFSVLGLGDGKHFSMLIHPLVLFVCPFLPSRSIQILASGYPWPIFEAHV